MITSNPWRLHVLLALLIGAQVLIAGSLRETYEQRSRNEQVGSTQAQLDALHVTLASAEEPPANVHQALNLRDCTPDRIVERNEQSPADRVRRLNPNLALSLGHRLYLKPLVRHP